MHATYCVIFAGASPGETKMWPAVRENGEFLHLRTCGSNNWATAEYIDGYMLRGVWQALNCLFSHATFCVIATKASPGQTKKEARGT